MYFKIILIALAAYVLILIAYPETRLWLKELIKKHPFLSSSLICFVLVIIAFLYFPPFFKYVALDFWKIPQTIYSDGTVEVVELADLGSIGDIFGSLNSFISSIALCAVAFSTWLQITSLKETREVNMRQFELAENSHREQIRESKISNFSNLFYSLLNQKQNKYNSLVIKSGDDEFNLARIFTFTSNRFLRLIRTEWNEYEKLDKDIVRKEFRIYVHSVTKNAATRLEVHSYFLTYCDLFNLINRSDLEQIDKDFFKQVVRNSMTANEQITLFWLGAYNNNYNFIHGSKIFSQFYHNSVMIFAKNFYDETCFSHPKILENWDKCEKEETPA